MQPNYVFKDIFFGRNHVLIGEGGNRAWFLRQRDTTTNVIMHKERDKDITERHNKKMAITFVVFCDDKVLLLEQLVFYLVVVKGEGFMSLGNTGDDAKNYNKAAHFST